MNLAPSLDAALTSRLYPFSSLSPKQLAFELGICDDSLWRYRTGRRVMPADTLIALMGFFRARGDVSFESEILKVSREIYDFLGLVVPQDDRVPWSVERLNLDSLSHPTAQHLARLAASESDLVSAAEAAGIKEELSLYWVDREEVICLGIGNSAKMRPAIKNKMVGRSLDAWPDRPYASLVKAQVLSADREGPSYHSMDGTVHGIRAPYKRVLFGKRLVASFTERVAA